MIETIFIGLWIGIFGLLCVTIKQALGERARESRRNEIRSFRRFLGYQTSARRRSRRASSASALQPMAA
jgi:hypothetical protein